LEGIEREEELENGGEGPDMANPVQERELDKKECCQV
jgi:hypothetical protein